jgi:hypothetical protein
LLEKSAALAGRLEPCLGKLAGDIVDSELLSATANATALELIAGQVLDRGTYTVEGDGTVCPGRLVRATGLPAEVANQDKHAYRYTERMPR